MQAFTPARGGFVSRLEEVERRIIARLVADVAQLLGGRLDEDALGPPAEGTTDEDVLAALDFEPGEEDGAPAEPRVPEDPALLRLLPPMSHDDPELAAELRSLTEDSLRTGKVERLAVVWRALREADADGAVRVPEGAEGPWLAALTDVRLVLAARLGIEDDADAEAVYRRAERGAAASSPGRPRGGEEETDEVAEAMATMYAALTWWQESLLQAIGRRKPRR